jgi:hypothetical protein
MASPVRDDAYRRPNFAVDGAIPEYFRRPAWFNPQIPSTLPSPPPGPLPMPPLPSPPRSTNPFPDPSPLPRPPQAPPPHDVDPPEHPNSLVTQNLSGRPEGAPENWLLAHYDQNGDVRRRPINSAPAGIGPAAAVAPAESAGGLLGMLYEMMQQRELKPDAGFASNPQDASQQAPPERRLGRRTYRV